MRETGEVNLVSGFVESVRLHGQRPALFVAGEHVTYDRLACEASQIAATISTHGVKSPRFAAVFAHRSLTAYAGVLGILLSGRCYVPLNPKFPMDRTGKMLAQCGSAVVVVGRECLNRLEELLAFASTSLTLIIPECDDVGDLGARFPDHRFVLANSMSSGLPSLEVPSDADEFAYLLFTSGSTGEPKGVPVSHGNVRAYVEFVAKRFSVTCEDRLSQSFDLTFDLSVHDLFVSWECGACVCSLPEAMAATPAKFIRDQRLTMWFSVPSVISFMSRLRLLRPGLFPTLRWSLFCGEALPEKSVMAWGAAANNSIIENLYGPTEATIAITSYRWDPEQSPSRCRNGITPIGWAFDGQRTCVVDEQLNRVPLGEPGELLLSGSQVTGGYWNNPEMTQKRFVDLADDSRWYRTGDRVIETDDGCLLFVGRFDDQVKVRGYRVELQEIDAVLRSACDADQVVSVAWPIQDGSADGIVAFLSGASSQSEGEIIQYCQRYLPEHMVPRRVHYIDAMPRNANGKIDRGKLAGQLEENLTG